MGLRPGRLRKRLRPWPERGCRGRRLRSPRAQGNRSYASAAACRAEDRKGGGPGQEPRSECG
eukprot:5001230-Alexandrium_andersonii.AAC.1